MTTTRPDLQRLLAEEPFVRSLAYSLVVDEADDVVQQAFLLVLEHRPSAVAQPRAWLAHIVHNVVIDHRRRRLRRDARQRAAAVQERVPSSSDLLEGEERRRALVAAVDGLPPQQRTIILLRYYDGLPPRHIAAELGLPVATVWNRLHAALQTLRQRLDADHGHDRRAWLVPLVPFATLPRAMPWRELANAAAIPTLSMGVFAMTTKIKIVAAAAVLLVFVGGWAVWLNRGGVDPEPVEWHSASLTARLDAPREPADTAPIDAAQRQVVAPPSEATATTGSLTVHVAYDDGSDASEVTVNVRRRGGDRRVGVRQARTDTKGWATFADLAPGRVRIDTDRSERGPDETEITAGRATALDLTIDVALTLTGIVVDHDSVPVPGAEVYLAQVARFGRDIQLAALTDAAGRFALRTSYQFAVVGARADGYAPSATVMAAGNQGSTVALRLMLPAFGGSVVGTVTDPQRHPVAGAVVRIGSGRTDVIPGSTDGIAAPPAQVLSDALGRFRAVGLREGTHAVTVRSATFAPWTGTCEVVARTVTHLAVDLSVGCTVRGTVRDERGEPVPDAMVSLGNEGELVHYRDASDAAGAFCLAGLPNTRLDLVAQHHVLGETSTTLQGAPGQTLAWHAQLTRGLELRGRFLTEAGEPAPWVEVYATLADWTKSSRSDAEGCFTIANCPANGLLTLQSHGDRVEAFTHKDVDPRAGEVVLHVRPIVRSEAKGRLTGRVLDPDGKPLGNAIVSQRRADGPVSGRLVFADSATGRFTIDHLPPGTYRVLVSAHGFPDARSADHVLAADATLDIGTVQLVHGGIVAVRGLPANTTDLKLQLLDEHDQLVAHIALDALRSPPIVPGAYKLRVSGPDRTQQDIAVQVRAQEVSTVEIR